MSIKSLPGLGPKSEALLSRVGIIQPQQLFEIGPMQAYQLMINQGVITPNLNFLYALVGAVENRPWQDVARNDKERLLLELEAAAEFNAMFIQRPFNA